MKFGVGQGTSASGGKLLLNEKTGSYVVVGRGGLCAAGCDMTAPYFEELGLRFVRDASLALNRQAWCCRSAAPGGVVAIARRSRLHDAPTLAGT